MVVKLMMLCNFRIGNSANATKYKSYGLTTIQWRHVKLLCNEKVAFSFVGKKGVVNEAVCSDRKVNKILHYMYSTSGIYRDRDHDPVFSISSSHVNDYLKSFSHSGTVRDQDISSKDLRTWQANALFMRYFNKNKDTIKHLKVKNSLPYQLAFLGRLASTIPNTINTKPTI
jgi:DNA topoisomerase-1